jgi:WD40-like Beta Propeller Repeat
MVRKHLAFAALVLVIVGGCGEAVREDRAADWKADGAAVAFQHDKEGVYVADKQGGGLTKIFEPDQTVLATSRPLFSPADGRLIFTTAHDPNGAVRPPETASALLAPEGSIVFQQPVKYTCWLRDEQPAGEEPKSPRALFSARCEHMGYVSAGLAVRWSPDGKRIVFIDSSLHNGGQHGVYEFDLASESTRRVFPQVAETVIFDFTPRGSHLVCVTGAFTHQAGAAPPAATGIWIGQPADDKSWWRVPGSERPAAAQLPSALESLRAGRPAWTADGAQFAYVNSDPEQQPGAPRRTRLEIVQAGSRKSKVVYEIEGQLLDLHWSPDGSQLGFVEQLADSQAQLRIYSDAGNVSPVVNRRPVRGFAGFDHTGSRVAFISPEERDLPAPGQLWALALPPDRLARDTVVVCDPRDAAGAAEVFSGMRVTFPVWSPTDNRLSLWITFMPRFRSWLSILFRWGLWPGDPAATLDLNSGAVSWLAVSPAEELQVGHYYLLKHDYARAREWYDKANRKLPRRKPPATLQEFVQTIGNPERSHLFEYICLTQLGDHKAAAARLAEFEETFFPGERDADGAANVAQGRLLDDIVRQFGSQGELLKRTLHDFYAAEVFLSVDAAETGMAWFREQLQRNDGPVNRLSRALALTQLLLIAGQREEYLKVCSELVIPLSLEIWDAGVAPGAAGATSAPNAVLPIVGGFCLIPLFHPEFLAGVSDEAVGQGIEIWDAQRRRTTADLPALALDLCLRASHLRLGHGEAARAIEGQLQANPATRAELGERPIDEALREMLNKARQATP